MRFFAMFSCPTNVAVSANTAVDDILDGYVEAAVELALQPCRGVRIRRIHDDDALRGVEKHPIMTHIAESIEIPGQVNDLAARRAWRRPLPELRLRTTRTHQQHRDGAHQKARMYTYGHVALLNSL
jgi:hypothetical protein